VDASFSSLADIVSVRRWSRTGRCQDQGPESWRAGRPTIQMLR